MNLSERLIPNRTGRAPLVIGMSCTVTYKPVYNWILVVIVLGVLAEVIVWY